MAWSLTKTDSITDFASPIYVAKSPKFIKTDSTTDPVTAIYSMGLKLYKNKLCRNLQLKTDSITHSITDISSKDLKLY